MKFSFSKKVIYRSINPLECQVDGNINKVATFYRLKGVTSKSKEIFFLYSMAYILFDVSHTLHELFFPFHRPLFLSISLGNDLLFMQIKYNIKAFMAVVIIVFSKIVTFH